MSGSMRSEGDAAILADDYSVAHQLHGRRTWDGRRFEQGWIMVPRGEDLEGWSGVLCLVVLDDGRIYHDNAGMGDDVIAQRYAGPDGCPRADVALDQSMATSRAAGYGAEHLAQLGPRTWTGERFDGGWVMVPEGKDLRWRFDLPAVVVLDDGRLFEDGGSQPTPFVIERYQDLLAREAGQVASQ